MPTPYLARGATLIELVITIVLLGVVSVTIGAFLVPTFTANRAMERRAGLVDAAESSLRRMARDIRTALPNSVRISSTATTFAIEMIPTADGGKYCPQAPAVPGCGGAANDTLNVGAVDATFEILGCFRNPAFIAASGTAQYRIVIGDLDGSAYAQTGVISTTGRNITIAAQGAGGCGALGVHHRITISGGGHNFPNASVNERLYVVQVAALPISYICDTATGTLRRYSGYGLQVAQPTNEGAGPLNAAPSIALVATNMSRCGVLSTTSSVQSTGIVTLQLGISADNEAIELLQQVQLDNSL